MFAADRPEDVFQKAVAALQSGNYAAAEAGFQQVLKLAPGHVGALGNLGVVYSRTKRLADAENVYKRLLRQHPDDPALLLNLGLAEFKRELYASALPRFARVAELDAKNRQARELLAACQLRTGQVDSAIAVLEGLRANDPRDAGALYLLGGAYFRQKEPEKAKRVLSELLAAAGPAQANFLIGKAYYDSGRFEDAVQAFGESLRLEPDFAGARLELGKTYISTRDNEKAIAELTAALRQDPQDAMAHYYLGSLLVQDDHAAEGAPHLEEARRLNPDFYGPYFYLAKAMMQQSKPAEAVPLLQRATRLNPEEPSAFYQLARALEACGRGAEARQALARVKELNASRLHAAEPQK
jgi:tetratricopeptide (TPR) repeat protein